MEAMRMLCAVLALVLCMGQGMPEMTVNPYAPYETQMHVERTPEGPAEPAAPAAPSVPAAPAAPSAPAAPVQAESALDAAFAQRRLALTPVDVANGFDLEDARILGLSPDGRTLLLTDGEAAYTLCEGELTQIQVSTSRSVENKYDNLRKCLMSYVSPLSPGVEGVVWSPDSRYAAMPNYAIALLHGKFYFDPIVLDTHTGKLILLDTYPSKLSEGAVMSHACFSADSRYFYALLYGKGFAGRVTLMRYDLETGEKHVLHSSDQYIGRPGFFEMRNGGFLGILDSNDNNASAGLALFVPSAAGYTIKKALTGTVQSVMRGYSLDYSPVTGYAMMTGLLAGQSRCMLMMGHEEDDFEGIYDNLYAIESLDSEKMLNLTEEQIEAIYESILETQDSGYVNIMQTNFSPDGRYAMLHCLKHGESALLMLKLDTLELAPIAVPEGYNAASMAMNQYFHAAWGADGTVLLRTDAVRAYRFE